MEDVRKWDELIPDALGLIFKHLPLRDILTVVPAVCKSWRRTVAGPYCWQEINLDEWAWNCNPEKPELIDRMLRLLVGRSCGSLRKLTVSGLTNDQTVSFVANHARSLQALRIQRSDITDSTMVNAAGKMSALTFLDLSYCINVGAEALRAIGEHCKWLTTLRRVMHPLKVMDKLSQDDEAVAIASTMRKLKHLEIAYLLVGTSGVADILEKCKDLELLDVRGCWNVNLDEKFVKRFTKLKLVGPDICNSCDVNGRDDNSDYSAGSSGGYLAWDFVAGEMDGEDEELGEMMDDFWEDDDPMEDVEMWFYDAVNAVDAAYDWPHSP
ncbi:F-box protein FBW2-like [Andrographis paniculata]|uniref:F-box protein FBW2-like n=1 Tax=Andrographis paniculata TaxID=175694 RepID=UPI0021E6F022|nr:F-box protein FBW2-like [Andrographis paniculata]